MPYKSQAQRRKFHAMSDRGEISESTVERWESHTPKGKKLPEKVKESALAANLGRRAGQQKQADENQQRPGPAFRPHVLPLAAGAMGLPVGGGAALGALLGLANAPEGRGLSGLLRGGGIGATTGLGALLGGISGAGLGAASGMGLGGTRGIIPGATLGGLGGAGLGAFGGHALGKNLMWFNPEDYEKSEKGEAREGSPKAASDLAGRLGRLAAA